MIIFCEECGARNDLSADMLEAHPHMFECRQCREMLMVAKPTISNGGLNAFSRVTSQTQVVEQPGEPISVLIVDDSSLLRKIIKEIFAKDDQIRVVGEAEHGLKALELIPELKPDVVTLDVNMPVMDGMTTIKHIMIKCPTPVVMFSTLTGQGSLETFESLRYGAVDFLQKPSSLLKEDLKSQHELIVSRVKNAARAGIDTIRYLRPAQVAGETKSTGVSVCRRYFAIGSSYGAYGSLLGLIPEIEADVPAAFLSVLYASASHVDAFANYLDHHSRVAVRRAVDGDALHAGTCYLASAFENMWVDNEAEHLSVRLQTNPEVKPGKACNNLMVSLAQAAKEQACGILLSGIGDDGLDGLRRILDDGGKAIVQDPNTCLCNDATAMAADQYELSVVLPGVTMAEAIRTHCLATGQ